jgi:hypothetical protein
MSIDEHVKALWAGQYREAPAVFEKNGKYYMLSSMCTGWNPNQGGSASSFGIEDRWSSISNFGDCVTFNSQPTAVVKFGEHYIYVADRWDPVDYNNSGYIFLPITIEDGVCHIEWADEIAFDAKTKTYSVFSIESEDYRIMANGFNSYLSSDGYDVFARPLSYKDENLIWNFWEKGNCYNIVHKATGKGLSSDGTMREISDKKSMLWTIEKCEDTVRIVNVESGKVFAVRGRRVMLASPDEKFGYCRIVRKY